MRLQVTGIPRKARVLTLGLVLASAGCEKKAPPDPHLERGYALLANDPEAALKELEQAREAQSAPALLGRGLALEGMRRYADAAKALEQAVAKGNEPAVLLALARVQLMVGQPDAARKNIDQVVAKSGSDLSALLFETCLAHDEARARTALAHLDAWQAQSPTAAKPETAPTELHLARASLLSQLEKPAERRKALETAQRSSLSSPSEALSFAVLAGTAGRTDLAASLLATALPTAKSLEQRRQVAELAHRLGQHEITRRALLALPGDDPAVILLRARHEVATQAPGVITSVRRALEATKDPATRVELRLALADAQLRSGKLAEARRETEALLAENASAPGAQLLLARIDLADGQTDAALTRLQPLLAGEAPAGAREIAALAHIAAKRSEAARPLVLALLEKEPQHHLAAKLLVAIELEAGRKKEAVTALADLVRRAPQDLTLRLLWIGVMRKVEEPSRVEQALRESVEKLPNEPRLWLELSRHHHDQKQDDVALSVLEEARKKNPQDPLIAAALAASLTQRGRLGEAAPLYTTVLEHAEGDVVALNNLAMFHVDQLDDAKRGVELAEKANRLAPMEPAITDTLGWALYRRGTPDDLKRAEQLLSSIRGKLSSATSKYHLGATLLAVGKAEEGKRLLQQALASTREFPEADEARRLLGQGS
jgi:tetratricopeptide (TPR) repeat protein